MQFKHFFSKILGAFDSKILENGIEEAVRKHNLCGKIIDYGCGQMPYSHLFKNSEITGADIENPTMETRATELIKNYKTELKSNSFDVGICAEVIEHVQEPERVLKELHRLIKPDGHLIITAPLIMPEHDERDYWRFTAKGLKLLIEKNGFKVLYQKPLTKNFHSAGHLTGNAIMLSLVKPGRRYRYIGAVIALPLFFIARIILAVMNKMSSLKTGYITSIAVCKKV